MDAVELARLAADRDQPPASVGAALRALIEIDENAALTIVYDLLAARARERPETGVIVDPGNVARRHWDQSVAAAVAVIRSPAIGRRFDAIADSLAESVELTADVLALVPLGDPAWDAIPVRQRRTIASLAERSRNATYA